MHAPVSVSEIKLPFQRSITLTRYHDKDTKIQYCDLILCVLCTMIGTLLRQVALSLCLCFAVSFHVFRVIYICMCIFKYCLLKASRFKSVFQCSEINRDLAFKLSIRRTLNKMSFFPQKQEKNDFLSSPIFFLPFLSLLHTHTHTHSHTLLHTNSYTNFLKTSLHLYCIWIFTSWVFLDLKRLIASFCHNNFISFIWIELNCDH